MSSKFFTYTNTSKDQTFMVPNLGLLAPGEESRPTEENMINPNLKQNEITEQEAADRLNPEVQKAKKEKEEAEKTAKDTKVLRGIDRTSKEDTDEVNK